MHLPPHLEVLEERTVPSGLWAALLGSRVISPDGGSTVFALEMGEIRVTNRYAFIAQAQSVLLHDPGVLEKLDSALAAFPDWGPGDLLEVRREYAFETFSSLASNLMNDSQGSSVEGNFPDLANAAPRETLSAAITDRSESDSEPSGSPLSMSAVASLASLWPLAGNEFGDVTTDAIVPQWVADAVFLESGPSGLPAPQADLVPAGDKHLTTVAAYLVGSPSASPPVTTPPAGRPDTGTTDFIVGFQAQTPDPPRPPADRQETPGSSAAVPARGSLVPADLIAAPVDVKAPDVSADNKKELPEIQKVTDDTPPSASESEDVPEEAGGGE